MDRDKLLDWSVLPLCIAVMFVAGAVAQDEPSDKPSLLQRFSSGVSSALGLTPAKATLDKPYKPKGELKALDLSKACNKKLTDGTNRVEGNTLESLPKGEQELAGVNFNIADGLIQLQSVDRPDWPKKVEGIPVDDTFAHLYIFHATQGGNEEIKDGTRIGQYVVHYEDKTEEVIPIVYGEDLRNWWNVDNSQKVKRGKVAWIGSNAGATEYKKTLRLYVSKWDNPRPDSKVTTIDYVSENAGEAGPSASP
jgi:hypothetical protein